MGDSARFLCWLKCVAISEDGLYVECVGVSILELGDNILGNAVSLFQFLQLNLMIIAQFEIHLINIRLRNLLTMRVARVHVIGVQARLFSLHTLTFRIRIVFRHGVLLIRVEYI